MSNEPTPVISVKDLRKTYRTPFRRRLVSAVAGISFTVAPGEVFGFLGPNGAGKTTTIRTLMGLIKPTSGEVSIFGQTIPSRAARQRLGFLPEAPYFYEYLSVGELLDLTGRMFGLDRQTRKKRAGELIELVGLTRARNNPLKSYSKGMLQRAGIAQSLVNDPELVVFDEPMSGLDPIGRKEVKDIMLHLRSRGKTIFFSTHILADVEAMADRIAIIVRGTMRDVGKLTDILDATLRNTDVRLRAVDSNAAHGLEEALAKHESVSKTRRHEDEVFITLSANADVDAFLSEAKKMGGRTVTVEPKRQTLEELFIRHSLDNPGEAAGKSSSEGNMERAA